MAKINKKIDKDLVIFQTKSGALELKADIQKETIWASQAQICVVFDIDQSVVSRHINNIFKTGELDEKSNMHKMHNAISDKPITYYSLDVVLGVGYRTNSAKAASFRRWATETLRKHIVDGYTINRSRIGNNYEVFLKAVEDVKKLLPEYSLSKNDTAGILELITSFASTWLSLESYDKENLPTKGVTKEAVTFTVSELKDALLIFKKELMAKKEATDIFGVERHGAGLQGAVGNVFATFGGKDLYATVEVKAAHLLYFIIKDHPFTDGNKRSGAFSFIWFLNRARILDKNLMNPVALTALTLLIAESNPKDKERMTRLILLLLKK